MVNYAFDVRDLCKAKRVNEKDIEVLLKWSMTEENVPELNSQQICIFLIACGSDLDVVKKCILGYYFIRITTPEIFEDRNTLRNDIIRQLQTVDICIVPKRTENNNAIVIQRLSDPVPSNYHMDIAIKYFFMCFDALVYRNPPDGVIIIYGMENCSVRHVARTKLNLLKVTMSYVQEYVPLKIVDIHVVNSMWFLPQFLKVIRPFVDKELMSKIHPHLTNELDDLYDNFVPRTHLPCDYGGDLPSIKELCENTYNMLTSLNEHFYEDELERKLYFHGDKIV